MDTIMITVETARIAARLQQLADVATRHQGSSRASAKTAVAISETAGPCAVHPYLDVRDAYIALTACCDRTIFHAAEDAFDSAETAPTLETRKLADAISRHCAVDSLTLEVPASGDLESWR